MLVLSRKEGETLLVGDDIEIRIVRIEGDQVRIGILAPKSIPILRGELVVDIHNETGSAAISEGSRAKELLQLLNHHTQPIATK